MYLIVTRSFPPELGGMQSLMWGLTKEMSKNFMIKAFADYHENHKEFDKKERTTIISFDWALPSESFILNFSSNKCSVSRLLNASISSLAAGL